jgi:ubiquinone/menaquinone biosynthesis C-methylase UbiE
LARQAKATGDAFYRSAYYDLAESSMDWQWNDIVWPFLKRYPVDYAHTLDFAAGHGRNSVRLIELAQHVLIVDINPENIEACRTRFAGDERFSFLQNDGYSLAGVPDGSITFLYSFDSMVHFAPEVIRAYMAEFARVMAPSAYGFCHHSNYTARPGGDFTSNPHWRNHNSLQNFADGCSAAGLEVVEQQPLDWDDTPSGKALDGLTLFRKPG